MRWLIVAMVLVSGCSGEANHLGNPLTLPFSGAATVIGNAAYEKRRAQVEVVVKSNFDAILADIDAGGGPALTKAMDTAQIPHSDRPTRITQMRGDLPLYAASPAALVTALMVYGG
ncbi:MAG: hypothetical protein AAFU41_15375 [Pseudomonadota bacterium]